MKQKILAALFAAFMMVAVFSVNAQAAETEEVQEIIKEFAVEGNAAAFAAAVQSDTIEVVDWGYCGNSSVEWGLTPDGILVLLGHGTMPDYVGAQFAPWNEYKDYIYAAVVSGEVNNIGAGAFRNHWNLLYIYLDEGVKTVGDNAFYNCTNLEEIEFPTNTLKTIGNSAFSYNKCTTLILPNSITSIGGAAFYGSKQLKSVQLPSGISYIAPSLFADCTSLTQVTIPKGVAAIYDNAFENCDSLEYINIPDTVTAFGNRVFYSCNKLKKVIFPNSVYTLGENLFFDCTKLETVDLPDYLKKISAGLFQECRALKSVEIPAQVTSIGARAFQGCHILKEIRIPVSVTQIGDSAFRMCYELEKASIMNSEVNFNNNDIFLSTHSDFVIRCHKNSTARTYALNNMHPYEFLDMSKVTDCFADVAEGKWYVNAVQYVFDKELMSGSGEYFKPTQNVTRAQVITTLYRLAGSPEVTDYSACEVFSDVAEGKYYTDAVCWSYNEGVATGNGDKYYTTGNLNRQQMAAFFFRFADYMGYDTTESADISSMLNADKVSSYAVYPMEWAVGSGLISGSETKDELGNIVYDLNPKGNTTRAQLSAILQRFCEKYTI